VEEGLYKRVRARQEAYSIVCAARQALQKQPAAGVHKRPERRRPGITGVVCLFCVYEWSRMREESVFSRA